MKHLARIGALLALLGLHPAMAAGQATPPEPQAGQTSPSAPKEDPASGSALTRAFNYFLSDDADPNHVPRVTVALGGIKPGSGVALGPAFGYTFADHSSLQLTAEYSLRDFKLLQLQYRSRPLFGNRVRVGSRVRWQDAPELPLFDLGVDSSLGRALYGERRTEVGGGVAFRPRMRWLLSAGGAFERYQISPGRLDPSEDHALTAVPQVAGLAADTSFAHVFAAASYDTRESPDYARSGWTVQGAVHEYHDASTGRLSFTRTDLFGDAIVPNAAGRGAFDVLVHAWASVPAAGTRVPFYLMPSLGTDYLRGYRLYRFRDPDAMLLSAEYRWALREHLDVLGFLDEGTVAARVRSLIGASLRPAVGVGLSLHSNKWTVARVELARGREGFQFTISFSSPSSGLF